MNKIQPEIWNLLSKFSLRAVQCRKGKLGATGQKFCSQGKFL